MLWILAFLLAVLDVSKRYKGDVMASRKVRGLITVNLDAVRWGFVGATPPINLEHHVLDIPKDTTELVAEGLRTINYSDFEASSEIFTRTERSFGGSKAEPPSRPNSYWDDPHFRPFFDNGTERNVTAQLGKTAYLHCSIRQLGDRTVSWVRQKDLHILTVGKYTYTSDQRFTSIHLEDSDDWTLEIKYTLKKDAGIYECQVSTEPKMSLSIMLNVVVAKAAIPEGPNMYIQSGSTINLTCVITESTSPPVYVFWYHDDRMINYDSIRGGIKVNTEKGPTTVSRLQIFAAQSSDSGNYSCIPSYADPANITVHVLNGEKPAAMQHGRQTSLSYRILSSPLLIFLLLVSSRGYHFRCSFAPR